MTTAEINIFDTLSAKGSGNAVSTYNTLCQELAAYHLSTASKKYPDTLKCVSGLF